MRQEDHSKPAVAVAIPAYNEGDAIADFLIEIYAALAPHVRGLHLIVVDDASTDDTQTALGQAAPELGGTLEVITNPRNLGHGPSVLAAYRRAVALEPDFVLQVDGDGQFQGGDLRRVLVLLNDEARAVTGVRRFRQDPWFRMTMTRLLRIYVRYRFGFPVRDANCPLRGYETRVLAELLTVLPPDSLVPNLYLTLVASHRGLAAVEVDVSHRVRRGRSPEGTTWGRSRGVPIPWRLVRFSVSALREASRFRAHMDEPGWARVPPP